MAKGGKGGENTKKVAGNAKKAEAAANKAAQAAAQAEQQETSKWDQGAKSNKKAQDAEAKKAEAERKKAEKAALLAEEEASMPSKPKNNKTAQKKNEKPARKLDLSQLDDGGPGSSKPITLNASGIDNALDALALAGSSNNDKVEKHPERRFKAAYAAFEEKRLPEIEQENPGLRRNQRMELCRKEFEKSPDNPFNQVSVRYDASKEDIAQIKISERQKVEDRLAG